MSNACQSLDALCVAVHGITNSLIEVIHSTGAKQYFFPIDDTNDARKVAFGNAVNAVTDGGKIVLVAGGWLLSQSIKAYAGTKTNWKLQFNQGSWLAYTNENLAIDDWFAYEGTDRYAENHGIFPRFNPSDPVVDLQPRIQAALFTMPPAGDAVWVPDAGPYTNIVSRRGRLHLNHGQHQISKTIYFTGYQQIYGRETRPANITQMAGFAPGPNEVFSMSMVRAMSGGTAASNFAFNCHVVNIGFDNADPAGNVKGSALLMGGAQGSMIDDISMNSITFRGIVYHPFTTYFQIGRIHLDGFFPPSTLKTGPHLEIHNCQGFSIREMNLQFINNHTAESGNRKNYTIPDYAGFGGTTNLAGAVIVGCRNFNIDVGNGESIGTLLRIVNSFGFRVGPCSCQEANESGWGESMVSLFDCRQYSVGPFHGASFERLILIQDSSSTVLHEFVSANAGYARCGAVMDDVTLLV